jgi:hypothetical protein
LKSKILTSIVRSRAIDRRPDPDIHHPFIARAFPGRDSRRLYHRRDGERDFHRYPRATLRRHRRHRPGSVYRGFPVPEDWPSDSRSSFPAAAFDYLAGKEEGIAQQLVGGIDIGRPIASRIRVELTDTCVEQVDRDLLQLEALRLAELFEQMIVALPALAITMVIADDDRMRLELSRRNSSDVLLRRLVGRRLP